MFKSLLLKVRVLCLLTCCILSSLAVTAQTRITGHIIGSDDRQPVVGAAVRINGTTIGTVTDVNGNFTISATSGQTLVVTYVGYVTQNVRVTGAPLSVTLVPGNNALNEVVVTGYTSQRKKDIAGAVATVDVTAAKQIPASTSDQLLQGQAAGVTVTTQGGPGQGALVLVRGIGNLANSQPLYVIDGVQTDNMRDVNPQDIESVSVLKDAGAAAIYGIAGGNGVIVVTTKKGRAGKSVFTYDGYYGTQKPLGGNPFNLLNAPNFAALIKQVDPTNALLNPATGTFYDFGYRSATVNGYANAGAAAVNPSLYTFDPNNPANDYLIQQFSKTGTDWFHEVFKNAPTQSHTVSGSGASDKNNYFFSMGYLNQQGTMIDTYYKRYQTRINTTFNIKDHIRIGENAQFYYTISPNNLFGGGQNLNEAATVSEIYRIQPQIPVRDIGGNFGGTYAGTSQLGNATNPVADQERTKNNYVKAWNGVGTVFAEADFLKHFTARTAMSGNINNYFYRSISTNTYESGENHAIPNSTSEGSGYSMGYNWSNTVRYNQIFGKHNITFLGGYEIKNNQNRAINGSGTTLFSTDPLYASLTGTTQNQVVTSGVNYQPTSTQSFFARLDYIYHDKYILGATIRRDGYSAFINQKYGNFPAANIAWRISQEDFMKGISWINDLKLRGSYGEAGFNANAGGANGFTTFTSQPSVSYYPITGSSNSSQQGFFNNVLGNPNTTWERDRIANVGLDATFANNHFDATFEYFVKNSSKLLLQVTLPASLGGAAAPFINTGNVRNKGFEGSLTYHGRVSDFTYNITGNLTSFKNKITSLGPLVSVDQAGSRIGTLVREAVGQPIGSFFGYKQIGYFSSAADVAASPTQTDAAPGRFKFADINGDGKITDADRTFIGNPNPNFTYGVNLNANYKGFDFTAVLYGSHGGKVYNYVKYWTNFYSTFAGNKSNDVLFNSWSPTNLNPAAPRAEAVSTFSTDQQSNSYYVESGSFLKAKVVQLGYTFRPNALKRIGVDKFNVYIQATNLFTSTKYSGLDPEVQAAPGNNSLAGIDYGNYPANEKKYLVGVRMSF